MPQPTRDAVNVKIAETFAKVEDVRLRSKYRLWKRPMYASILPRRGSKLAQIERCARMINNPVPMSVGKDVQEHGVVTIQP
jgi:hypothetical protein